MIGGRINLLLFCTILFSLTFWTCFYWLEFLGLLGSWNSLTNLWVREWVTSNFFLSIPLSDASVHQQILACWSFILNIRWYSASKIFTMLRFCTSHCSYFLLLLMSCYEKKSQTRAFRHQDNLVTRYSDYPRILISSSEVLFLLQNNILLKLPWLCVFYRRAFVSEYVPAEPTF